MRLVYMVPRVGIGRAELTQRVMMLRAWAAPGTAVDIIDIPTGPASIESMVEEYLSIPEMLKTVLTKEQEGYDAAIVGCFGDPGLDAMRELTTRMPIVGPGEASLHVAAMLGYRFSIVAITQSVVIGTYHHADRVGLRARLASVRVVDTPVLELQENRRATLGRVREACQRCLDEDHADVIVLGCMTMAFMDVAKELSHELGVPVINVAQTALKAAEMLVALGLSHSKACYLLPPKLASGQVTRAIDLLVP